MRDIPAAGGDTEFRCGFITIMGRPNVGKSTLLNRLLGQKISITSRKPQTTRWHLLGIDSGPEYQAIFIDTPGIQSRHDNALNRHMTREAVDTLTRVDLIIFVVEALKWNAGDEYVAGLLEHTSLPLIIVVNKTDKVEDKKSLLPFISRLHEKFSIDDIIPISAKTGDDLDRVRSRVIEYLPCAPPAFPEDQLTDRSGRFLASEFLREKLTQKLGRELPYRITVTTDEFSEENNLIRIHVTVWVESDSQKAIVIGKNGAVMKSAGEQARHDMENLFGKKVYLNTWVKVKRKWTETESALRQLGYTDNRNG